MNQTQNPSDDDLLKVGGIANELDVPPSWIYARTRIKDGNTIPHIRVGKYLRFRKSEVMAWLEKTKGKC